MFKHCGQLRHLIIPAVFIVAVSVDARVWLTGSNPMLSSIALPQDLLLIPGGDKISSYTSWQGFPWWGDIDEPENRPYKKYVLTGEKTPEGEYKTSLNQYEERFSVSHWRSEKFRTNYDLYYSAQHLNVDAARFSGGEDPAYTYHERHAIREGYLKGILATYYKTLPIGLSLGLGGIHTAKPKADLEMGDGMGRSDLLLWGWEGHGNQRQENFAIGSLFKSDAQVAATFENHKVGSHFRYYAGRLDNYNWISDSTGREYYDISPKKIHNYTVRLYGIYNWYKQEKFRFNTTILTRYTFVDSIGMRGSRNSVVDYKEKSKTFVFQINPNVNIYPWKYPMSFIDAALLCNYQHMRYDFLNPDNSFAWTGWYGSIDDFSWEDFSYARENFFELALDIFASIPVFGMKDRSAGVVISALIWRRYKWMNKYFGHMENSEFLLTNVRKNFDKETWLNTVVNLVYRHGNTMYRLDVGQPLIYSLTPRTTIYDGSDHVVAKRGLDKMWLSQSGFKIGFFISTDLTNFIRYQPFARPEPMGYRSQ